MKLLTKEIRKNLPRLKSQDGKGGDQIALVKFFHPMSNWTWYVSEGEPVKNENGEEVDYYFFALVEGHYKEMGEVALSELESVRGPFGLRIERDLYWEPKTFREIAPELFKNR